MATAAISGKTGTVDGATTGEITQWNVNVSQELLDATSFGSAGWREFILGLQGATGTLESLQEFTGGATLTLDNSAGGSSITGNVLFGDDIHTNETAGIRSYSHTFTFTGEVTVA